MYEKTVVVAEFASAAEAHLALGRLEAESIQGVITGEDMNPATYSLFGLMPYASPIQLLVAESQAQLAREILAGDVQDEPLPENWEAQAEAAVDGWICHLCDTSVEENATECPACQEPRKLRQKKRR
jgi:hypothetical protein